MGVAQAKPACKHTIATRKCYQYNMDDLSNRQNDIKVGCTIGTTLLICLMNEDNLEPLSHSAIGLS